MCARASGRGRCPAKPSPCAFATGSATPPSPPKALPSSGSSASPGRRTPTAARRRSRATRVPIMRTPRSRTLGRLDPRQGAHRPRTHRPGRPRHAGGGNPDPTSTGGKDPAKAKALELAGWDHPKHLDGRAYGRAWRRRRHRDLATRTLGPARLDGPGRCRLRRPTRPLPRLPEALRDQPPGAGRGHRGAGGGAEGRSRTGAQHRGGCAAASCRASAPRCRSRAPSERGASAHFAARPCPTRRTDDVRRVDCRPSLKLRHPFPTST
jgi:hypothetical protein